MENLKAVNLTQALENNFARYAGMVIQDRAIIDVRDGLKPAARQLAYAQYIDKITYNKPFKKATKSVASGMSHFYVHGDASAYSTLIRMGKPFAMRYPLEEVQGSYGNQMENDNEAASRYVEMRLSKLGTHLFESIEENTISKEDWRENYDATELFPAVLPSVGFYNLVQGSTGIGVALASSIPQFNLVEVNNALIKMLWKEDIDFDEIYCPPDFATGGTVINGDEVKESLRTGTGAAIKIRANIDIDYEHNQLIVTELPYGVYTNTVCHQLADLMENEPNCGILKFLDLTGEKPLLKITAAKGYSLPKLKEFLYKNTSLQSYFGVNMVMLKDGKVPRVFGLQEAFREYLAHSKIVLCRKIKFNLAKAEARLEIVLGYLKALSVIDEVVALIKAQPNSAIACVKLMEVFNFSERQAKAILDLKLNRLVNMEITKIQEEEEKLKVTIQNYKDLLTDNNLFLKELEKLLTEVRDEFGDERRTTITNIDEEAPIVEEKVIMAYMSNHGAIIAKEMANIDSQKRGGAGAKIKFNNKQDYIWKTIVGKTTEKVLVFSNKGKSYNISLADFPINEEFYIHQLLNFDEDEFIIDVLTFDKAQKYKYVLFATEKGIVKKTKLNEYLHSTKKGGLIAIKIQEDDKLVTAQLVENDNDEVILATEKGMCLIFDQGAVSATGRNTVGVKGIKLNDGDKLITMRIKTDKNAEMLTMSAFGNSKRMAIDEFQISNRANKGTKLCSFKEDNDKLVDVILIDSINQEFMVNSSSNSLRVKISDFPLVSKGAIGNKSIRLQENQTVQSINLIEK